MITVTRAERETPSAEADPAPSRECGEQSGGKAGAPVLRWYDLAAVAACTIAAAALRLPEMGARAMWYDDSWVAYAARARWSELPRIGLTSVGFTATLKAWFTIVGFSDLKAQMLPFVASTVGPAIAYLGFRRHIDRTGALVVAALLVVSPVNVRYAYQVKQYTLEVLLAVVLMVLALRWLRHPNGRNGALLAGAMLGACMLSFMVVVACLGPVALVASATAKDHRLFRSYAVPALVTAPALGAWYLFVVRPRIEDFLVDYWRSFYLVTDQGLSTLADSARDRFFDLMASLLPLPAAVGAAVVLVAFVVVARRRPILALACAAPLFGAVVLAALQKAPLGTGRTDAYLLAPVALAVGAAFSELSAAIRRRPFAPRCAAALAMMLVLAVLAVGYRAPVAYPVEDIHAVVDDLEARRQEGDAVIVYRLAVYAFGLYGESGSRPVDSPNHYRLVFDDPQIFPQDHHNGDPLQYREVAQAAAMTTDRIWLVGQHVCDCDWLSIESQLRDELGYTLVEDHRPEGAALQLWVRKPTLPHR